MRMLEIHTGISLLGKPYLLMATEMDVKAYSHT